MDTKFTVPVTLDMSIVVAAVTRSFEQSAAAAGAGNSYRMSGKVQAMVDAEVERLLQSPEFLVRLKEAIAAGVLRGAEVAAEANGRKAGGRASASALLLGLEK
jgi:hypothetical protein